MTCLQNFYNEFDSIPFCELNLSDAKRTFDGYNFIVKGDLFENIIGPLDMSATIIFPI